MQLNYYSDPDLLYIDLSSEGIVLDCDASGNLVGIDTNNASRKVDLKKLTLNKFPAAMRFMKFKRCGRTDRGPKIQPVPFFNPCGLLPGSRHDHRAAALEACAAAARTAPVDFTGFVLPLVSPAFWKNYLLRITLRAMVDSSGYESRLDVVPRDLQPPG